MPITSGVSRTVIDIREGSLFFNIYGKIIAWFKGIIFTASVTFDANDKANDASMLKKSSCDEDCVVARQNYQCEGASLYGY